MEKLSPVKLSRSNAFMPGDIIEEKNKTSLIDFNDLIIDFNKDFSLIKYMKKIQNEIFSFDFLVYQKKIFFYIAVNIKVIDTKTNEEFKLTKKLGGGAYGIVYLFKSTSTNRKFAMKITTDSHEYAIVNYLERKKIDCKLLGAKVLHRLESKKEITENNLYKNFDIIYFIGMVAMDGDLVKLLENTDYTEEDKFLLYSSIANIVTCFQQKKLYFLDLKMENVFYAKFNESGLSTADNINLFLGDFGSFIVKGSKGPATCPPWKYRKEATSVVASDETIQWLLFALCYTMLTFDISLAFSEIVEFKDLSTLSEHITKKIIKIENDTIRNYLLSEWKTCVEQQSL